MGNSELEFDRVLLDKLMAAFEKASYDKQVGDYWSSYVRSIIDVMKRDRLTGFGHDYFLTQGFGDAHKYKVPRRRVRTLLRFPFLYELVEKYLVIWGHWRRRKLFSDLRSLFKKPDFVAFVAQELDPTVRSLDIKRFYEIDQKRLPFRYWMALIYLEMLYELAERDSLSVEDMAAGNYVDIGGGYGSSVDLFALLKRFVGTGVDTVNYDIDQFPVTFIANQYLKFRDSDALLPPIADEGDIELAVAANQQSSAFRVIQNNIVDKLSGLNISLFFNSNSFQEMDEEQIENYCDFMDRNKAANARLGVFLYDSEKKSNTPKMPLEILHRRYTAIGKTSMADFFKSRGFADLPLGIIKGSYYLFDLSKA